VLRQLTPLKARRRVTMSRPLPVRAYLLHLTHYDPSWCRRKARERQFSLRLSLEVVDAMAAAGYTTLVVDCADAVRYQSHPELTRPYTAPMRDLATLARRAHRRGLDVAPKLNFSQSHWHCHNHWFRPHHLLFDSAEYWRRAFRIIDELILACGPRRYFHVGMDEDHERSTVQYVRAIRTLRDGLRRRGLKTVIWNDTAYPMGRSSVHAEKSLRAEADLPHDIVQVLWDYERFQPEILRRLRRRGFEVWAAPGRDAGQIARWHDAVRRVGGRGLLVTLWIPCRPRNRKRILDRIRQLPAWR
jgi:hypothetical protein